VSNVVVRLYEQGARFVLVPNTVDVTDIPTFNFLPGFYRDYIRDWIEVYNARLLSALQTLGQEREGLTLYHVDVYSRTKAMLEEAEAYGFTETDVGALLDPELADKGFDGPGRDYVYWDIIHPTTKVHGIVADWILSVVRPRVPETGISRGDGGLTLTLSGMHAGGDYRIERTRDFQEWDVIGRLRGYGESAVEEPLAADGTQGFHRVIYER
jgi:phospholipase/lecithinase/hemolysin